MHHQAVAASTDGPEDFEKLDDVLALLASISPEPVGLRGDTRERLIDASLELFAERGVTATTIRAICGTLSITPAAFYSHFPSKDELLVAAIAKLYTAFFGYVFEPGRSDGPIDLLTLAERHMRFQFAFPTLAESGKRFLYNANAHLPASVGATVQRVRQFYVDQVVLAIREHGARSYVPEVRLADAVIAICDQVSYGSFKGDPTDPSVIPTYLRMIQSLVEE